MKEFFIVANSFAAPFVSDTDKKFVHAPDTGSALKQFAKSYKHPFGLYAAMCYESADAYHKGRPPLAKWLCNHEIAKQKAAKGKSSYVYCCHGPGDFTLDDEHVIVKNPKDGQIVSTKSGTATE